MEKGKRVVPDLQVVLWLVFVGLIGLTVGLSIAILAVRRRRRFDERAGGAKAQAVSLRLESEKTRLEAEKTRRETEQMSHEVARLRLDSMRRRRSAEK